jgi:hypothetical protein
VTFEFKITGIDILRGPLYIANMSIDQIKDEIKVLRPEELDQVAALILQIRRDNDPDRKAKIGEMIDDQDVVAWEAAPSE